MSQITLSQAALWCGGQIDEKYANVTFLGANMDSRKILPGQLFVALKAERDGHAFIGAALEKGAAAVLCSHADGDYPAIVVADPRIALGEIARNERLSIGMKTVAVTGSVGKSTTKEMIACVLAGDYLVSKTPANFNNDLGMPMAILDMPRDTQAAVLEMGMSHAGEIGYLSRIGLPDVGVITNIGTMHMENLGSREGIRDAKLELLEGMEADRVLCLNGDDDMLWGFRDQTQRPITYFGIHNDKCQIRAEKIREAEGKLFFEVATPQERFPVELPLEGEHFVIDALAAIAAGLALGIRCADMASRLAFFQTMAGRQEIWQEKGFTIISDCYNAGPESMAAALKVLGKRSGRRIAVLADMLELGSTSQAEHYKVGRLAAENADMVFAYGPNAKRIVSGAVTGGIATGRAQYFEERRDLVQMLKRMACPGDVILFKGSHGMHLELVLEQFLKDEN